MKTLLSLIAACAVQVAHAQPPVPSEVLELIAETEQDTGTTRFGATHLGELDDGEMGAVDVNVDASKWTYVLVEGEDYTISIKVRALAGTKEIAASRAVNPSPILQIPPGSGDKIRVELEMSCEEISCRYFTQAFVR